LNKNANVIGVDFSSSVDSAAKRYLVGYNKTIFLQANIAAIPMLDASCDLILCDQVLHHTENPQKTLNEFWRILKPGGKLLTYVYRKKALPRELLDEYFRTAVHDFSDEELWSVARGMTQLGKVLSDNDIYLEFPDINPLGIKGGKQSLQRFLYWNFFKCFWNDDFGFNDSLACNYDWYSPSIAFRYSAIEFLDMISNSGFLQEYLHEEEACISGRFIKSIS
jgi:ubiquinone/menaquinone biosynthesis C-methylase UbiE